jgi:hypothetical protein
MKPRRHSRSQALPVPACAAFASSTEPTIAAAKRHAQSRANRRFVMRATLLLRGVEFLQFFGPVLDDIEVARRAVGPAVETPRQIIAIRALISGITLIIDSAPTTPYPLLFHTSASTPVTWKQEQRTMTTTVEAAARFALHLLRSHGLRDREILTEFTQPNPEVDAEFETEQMIERGIVTMPALDVKNAMRRLLAN